VGTPLGHRDYAGRQFKNDKIPIGHIGSPEDIGEAVAFLVSEKAKHILGAILSVDGGFQVSH
jgi:NAD(P)-dependent dehydrogenase (short-subunit alcohol dehydrogenase family)